ncbi:hypothetical protein [Deinococcus soli (ex Cha et al. 2016)]|uniref:Uncharacterized protein n=2 Tax=Deinococcus soli (ex Cha et al. 2016) TaxID=1309411 RepID=A0AAE3XF52_9DEIO|nr:hypothetical protein [Deinococcus soli (ex Cha et al. 2016)]MDR6218578.1 hypothetical protein [Deinococcus soli (ex Cha et al. 2016)]MDR6328375.1 hypothetical protein [Deinococcus soli (ex Cha et al. 2016)]MDR6752986.1 hypothetical protein [Deinococcus soli (ex Cha et al. 2016)]
MTCTMSARFPVYAGGDRHPALVGATHGRMDHSQTRGAFLPDGTPAGHFTECAAYLPGGALLSHTHSPGTYVDASDQAVTLISHQHLPAQPTDGHAATVIRQVLNATQAGADVTFTLLDDHVTAHSRFARAAIAADGHPVGELRYLCGRTGRTDLWFYPLSAETGPWGSEGPPNHDEGTAIAGLRFTYEDGQVRATYCLSLEHQREYGWAQAALRERHAQFVRRAATYAARARQLPDPPQYPPVRERAGGALLVTWTVTDDAGYITGVLTVESVAMGDARVHWQPKTFEPLTLPDGWDPTALDTAD